MRDQDAFESLFENAESNFEPQPGLYPEVYAAAFSTTAGRLVLEDLYRRYVNVSRCVPGEPEGSGFYREGMAQVVFDIVSRIVKSEETDNDQEAG